MIAVLVLPALAALAVGLPAASRHRRLHPRIGARALALATAALALAALAAVGTVAVGFVSAVPWVQDHIGWCRDVARTHDEVPLPLGVAALATLVAMAVSAGRAYCGARAANGRPSDAPADDVEVLEDDRPDAYAVGGPRGRIVVTSGMLGLLEPAEREVLVAHERSHLRHRHDRYTTLAVVAAAAFPPLGFVSRRLRLALERWADEDAAAEVGDRRLVARAIIRASLGVTDYTGPTVRRRTVIGLGLLGVPCRVDALLVPAPDLLGGTLRALAPAALGSFAVVAGSAVQVHHLARFASHVCGV